MEWKFSDTSNMADVKVRTDTHHPQERKLKVYRITTKIYGVRWEWPQRWTRWGSEVEMDWTYKEEEQRCPIEVRRCQRLAVIV
ncbi:hypothetical protein H5410_005578 [Solanum commersonii]|uniref:Uncharacterized protein n=1 Tax=Solanum commersonii TaxID=4109 RepID=A0A9J6A7I9_SOLCO|nr:hypothetical protein H5410_005578 [Solanum commersonii]